MLRGPFPDEGVRPGVSFSHVRSEPTPKRPLGPGAEFDI
jgi:hypothetical protein